MSIQPIDTLSHVEPSLYTTEKSGAMGKEDFLTLLMAQVENQDPLNPQDPAEFTSQLTQFSSLEQMFTMTKSVEGMTDSIQALQLLQVASNNTQAVSLIGKDVLHEGNEMTIEGGAADDLRFYVPEDLRNVQVNILKSTTVYDGDGNIVGTSQVVRTINAGAKGPGAQIMSWDGLTDYGEALSDGQYKIEVTGQNAVGESVSATPLAVNRATGVNFEAGATYLEVAGQRIPLSKIYSVYEP